MTFLAPASADAPAPTPTPTPTPPTPTPTPSLIHVIFYFKSTSDNCYGTYYLPVSLLLLNSDTVSVKITYLIFYTRVAVGVGGAGAGAGQTNRLRLHPKTPAPATPSATLVSSDEYSLSVTKEGRRKNVKEIRFGNFSFVYGELF